MYGFGRRSATTNAWLPNEPHPLLHVAEVVARLEMIYTHVVAALLAATLAATSAWQVQGWRLGEQAQASKTALESLKREHAESLTRATGSALNATIAWQKEKDDAIDRAQQRAKAQAHSADIARRERDSLRNTIAAASLRLPDATPSACTEYGAAVSGLLDQCSAAHQELARSCDGHAADVRLMQEAWPVVHD